MNILLWILQTVLAWFCIAGGLFQIFKLEQLQKTVTSMRALPHRLWMGFGAVGCLAGVGLILPGVFHVFPGLTPAAAAIVAVESMVISACYSYYRDFSPLIYSIAMVLIAAFVAYGRFVLTPL